MDQMIKLGNKEADIHLMLPGGQVIQLQYRLESPSIDICLPDECCVTNWQGDDMEPAVARSSINPHIRQAKQLVVDLNPDWIDCP